MLVQVLQDAQVESVAQYFTLAISVARGGDDKGSDQLDRGHPEHRLLGPGLAVAVTLAQRGHVGTDQLIDRAAGQLRDGRTHQVHRQAKAVVVDQHQLGAPHPGPGRLRRARPVGQGEVSWLKHLVLAAVREGSNNP